jgi:hypothetical protein
MSDAPLTNYLCILIAVLPLTGCDMPQADTSNTQTVLNRPGPSFYFHEVLLKDGTRCVVSTTGMSDGGTGVTCDWGGPKHVE